MILLLSVLSLCLVSAQETNEPDFGIGGVGEGEEPELTVPIPIDMLRNALWYYDNYWIQKELAETYKAEYERVNTLLDEEQEVSAGLEASLQVWKPVAITTTTVFTLWIAAELVTLFVQ